MTEAELFAALAAARLLDGPIRRALYARRHAAEIDPSEVAQSLLTKLYEPADLAAIKERVEEILRRCEGWT